MGRKQGGQMAADVAKVRKRVEAWRRTRTKRSPMPEPLWEAAVALAREHGVYRVSQDLGVNYETLKTRLARSSEDAMKRATPPTFVEIEAPPLASHRHATEVEVEDPRGGKLTIRLGADAAVDVCALVDAFRGGRRR